MTTAKLTQRAETRALVSLLLKQFVYSMVELLKAFAMALNLEVSKASHPTPPPPSPPSSRLPSICWQTSSPLVPARKNLSCLHPASL